MSDNAKLLRLKRRWGLALVATLAIVALYAEGLLDNSWSYLLSGGIAEDDLMIGNGKPWIALALMAPIVAYLIAPSSGWWFRGLLIIVVISGFLLVGADLLLRLPTHANDFPNRWLPELPWMARFDPNLNVSGQTFGSLARTTNERQTHPIVFKTDAAGFRNTHSAQSIDVLVIGDSFAVGENTTQDRTFSRILETRYGRRVYNVAHPGSPYEEYVNLIIELPHITFTSNALAIWTIYTGDLYDTYGTVWDPGALQRNARKAWITNYRTFRERSPIRRQIMSWRRALQESASGQAVIARVLPNGQSILFDSKTEEQGALSKSLVEQHHNFPWLERTIIEMRNRMTEKQLNLTIVLIPAKGEVYHWILTKGERTPTDGEPSGFALAVLDVCRRAQVRCLDTKPHLMKEAYHLFDLSGELLYWTDDAHFNEHGHNIVAAFIDKEILESNQHLANNLSVTNGSASLVPADKLTE